MCRNTQRAGRTGRARRTARLWAGAALLPLPLLATACGAYIPPVPVGAFEHGDLAVLDSYYQEQLREGDTNSAALFLNGLATIELLQGQLDAAMRHFRTAGRIMGNWQVAGSEVFGAVVGEESSKTYRGDPYEKAMNAYYTGLLYLWRGEPDNARAAFKMGILADAETNLEPFRTDFALLYWLAGRMSLAMGKAAEAESFFDEAREARKTAVRLGARGAATPEALEQPAAGNLVCLVDIGLGPQKVATGPHGAEVAFAARANLEQAARIYVDDRLVGTTQVLADIPYQAATQGLESMQDIREGKALLKDVSAIGGVVLVREGLRHRGGVRGTELGIGLGLLALSLLTRAEADVRHWTILPDTVQVLATDVAPGRHELRVVFVDAFRRVVPDLTQTWNIDVPADGDSYYYFRSVPGLDRMQRVNP